MNYGVTHHAGIIRQYQPTPETCVHTCIAMAIGAPVDEIIGIYGSAPLNQQRLCQILTEWEVDWNQFVHGNFLFEGWYFVTVPSLNFVGGNHMILVHYSLRDGYVIFDPNEESPTVKVYDVDGENFRGRSYLTPFHPGGNRP